ncbi:MAG: outer membrane protein assembly factor BamC [Gammaproteobacteria bacterium]
MMRGLMVRGLILGLCLSAMLGCSWFPTFDDVVPDRSKEYQKSASLPDLEIPPDLSSDAISDSLSVPEVDAKGTASYSTYQERIARRGGGERSGRDSGGERYRAPAAPPSPAEESPEDVPTPDDTTALDDSRSDDRRSYEDRDERIADEDAARSSPLEEDEPASEVEPDPEFESQSYATRTPAGGREDEPESEEEPEEDPGEEPERETERSPPPTAVGVGQTGAGGRAELVSAGEGRKYLRVTEDFSEAWHLTGQALAKAGFTVADEDRDRGVYFVDFTGAPGAAPEQAGFLSSLAFWRGDDTEHEVQLTGIGEKTEVVVLDEDGNWESGPVADEILTRLETALNQVGEELE